MLLTEAQFHEIVQIIADHHSAFLANAVGPDVLAADTLDELKQKGLVNLKATTVKDAYLYGQALAAMNDPKAATMSLDEFKAYLRRNPVPLSAAERQAINMAQLRAAQYVRGLGNRVSQATGALLIEADAGLRAKLQSTIRTEVEENVERRESIQQLKSNIGWAAKDWTRDLNRISVTEKHNAMQEGLADHYFKRFGSDVQVAVRPMADACRHCKRLHLGPDGAPRIFKLATLVGNGTNVGRKAANWLPVVGAVHPHCQCQMIRVPAGWGFNKDHDLVPGGKLGVHYEDEGDLEMALLQEADLQKAFAAYDRLEFQGLPIVIENAAGTTRHWTDASGESGSTVMLFAYGYVDGTMGADGDAIDVYVGPDPRAPTAYVMHQQDPATGRYDEEKVMLGFANQADAELAYRLHYNRPDFLVAVSPMPVEHFARLARSTKPFQKSQALERFVIVQKAEPLSSAITPEQGALESRADARAPSPSGTAGVNFYFKVPPRTPPATGKDVSFDPNARDLVTPEQRRQKIKRDPAVYDMIEPAPKPAKPIELADHAGSPIGTGVAEHHRDWLERHHRALQGEPNRTDTVQKPEDEDDKEERGDVIYPLAKADDGTYQLPGASALPSRRHRASSLQSKRWERGRVCIAGGPRVANLLVGYDTGAPQAHITQAELNRLLRKTA